MAILDSITLAADDVFQKKITHLVVKAAHAIMNEDSGTANHAARVTLAKQALAAPEVLGKRFAYGVVTNGAITAASTDSDLEFTVNSLWNSYAGIAT